MNDFPYQRVADEVSRHGLYMRTAVDTTLGAAGVSIPTWLDRLDGMAQHVVILGGAILMFIRIMQAVVELLQRPPKCKGCGKRHFHPCKD